MKKFWKTLSKILRSIIAVPLGIILAIMLTPVYLIMWMLILSELILEDIWEVKY